METLRCSLMSLQEVSEKLVAKSFALTLDALKSVAASDVNIVFRMRARAAKKTT